MSNEIMGLSLSEIAEGCTLRAERAKALAVAPDCANNYDAVRRDNNAYLKGVKSRIDEARKEYLAPFEAVAGSYLKAIEPLEEANRSLSASILDAKKRRFRDEMAEAFSEAVVSDVNGELPDFEEVFDPRWYGMAKADARKALAQALRKAKLRGVKKTASYRIEADGAQLEDLESYLLSQGIRFEKE